ncbi:MAG: 5-(carboxyamino)imidazole ribonucleotide mutase, partial [Ignavibacteriales bacterium CG12_big_fil_rev_8_21_14_0_65_30_8]
IEILALSDNNIKDKLNDYRIKMAEDSMKKNDNISS